MKLIKGTSAKAYQTKESRFYLLVLKPPYWWIRFTPKESWKYSKLGRYIDFGKVSFRYGNEVF